MIDIHSHILYDIEGDDGSRSLDMSLGMLRQAAASSLLVHSSTVRSAQRAT